MPRPDMRAARIPQILTAALAVFGRNGFAQTRMDDIAQEVGLSKATLYLYFPSKDDLITALLEGYFAQSLAELNALSATAGPLVDSLIGWLHRRWHELEDNPGYLGIGFEFHALATREPRTRAIVQRAFAQYHSTLTALLAAGMQRGELPPGDASELAIAIMGLTEGLTMLWMLEPQRHELGEVAERTIRRLLTSVTSLRSGT